MYEPFVAALSVRFLMPLPPVFPGRTGGQLADQRLDASDQGFPAARRYRRTPLTTTRIEFVAHAWG